MIFCSLENLFSHSSVDLGSCKWSGLNLSNSLPVSCIYQVCTWAPCNVGFNHFHTSKICNELGLWALPVMQFTHWINHVRALAWILPRMAILFSYANSQGKCPCKFSFCPLFHFLRPPLQMVQVEIKGKRCIQWQKCLRQAEVKLSSSSCKMLNPLHFLQLRPHKHI